MKGDADLDFYFSFWIEIEVDVRSTTVYIHAIFRMYVLL